MQELAWDALLLNEIALAATLLEGYALPLVAQPPSHVEEEVPTGDAADLS